MQIINFVIKKIFIIHLFKEKCIAENFLDASFYCGTIVDCS